MFADNTLTPKEAVRLCALGTVARGPMSYGALAGSVRHFLSRIAGPQLELMGVSIELLRCEGLVQAAGGSEDDPLLTLTPSGQRELHTLLTARLRAGSDLSRLIVALKMRFLDLLDAKDQRAQADLLADGVETELARLIDLRGACAPEGEALTGWLDLEISLLEQRLSWLEAFGARV